MTSPGLLEVRTEVSRALELIRAVRPLEQTAERVEAGLQAADNRLARALELLEQARAL